MLTLSLLITEAQQPEEEKVEPASASATTHFTDTLRSVYSQVICFFYPPNSSDVNKKQGELSQNRRLQNWYARHILLLEEQLSILNEYLRDITEGTVFNLIDVNILRKSIETYFAEVNTLVTKINANQNQTEPRDSASHRIAMSNNYLEIMCINNKLRDQEASFASKNMNTSENSLRYFQEKLAQHLNLMENTDNKYDPQDIDIILNYIFCADMYKRKFETYGRSDETILAGLAGLKEILTSKNYSTSPFELKFQTTSMYRLLKNKIKTVIEKNTQDLAECNIKYEFYAAKVRNLIDEIDDLKFTEEQALNASQESQPEGYQALSGGV